jgi:hypothetical protein
VEKAAETRPEPPAPACPPEVTPTPGPGTHRGRLTSLLWSALFAGLFLLVLGIYVAIRVQRRR